MKYLIITLCFIVLPLVIGFFIHGANRLDTPKPKSGSERKNVK